MCTLTWWREQDRYGVFFNRDEKKDRPIAEPPAVRQLNGIRFLSPRDPRAGGTWMLANEFGVIVCLLNKWHLGGVSSASKSRGQLVLGMGEIQTAKKAVERLTDLENYPPFSLFTMDGEGECFWEWDGKALVKEEAHMPLTSSSYCFEEVKAAREKRFAEGFRGDAFHEAVGEEASAYTVRMCRPDAQTWSRSRVSVGEKIEWDYFAEEPDFAGDPRRSCYVLPRC